MAEQKKENQVKTIYQRLIEAQSNMKNPAKNGVNPFFKKDGSAGSSYATLDDTLDCVLPCLNAAGLFLTQPVEPQEDNIHHTIRTEVFDGTGESIMLSLIAIAGGTPQQLGSAITYARRYSILTAFGIVGDDDDDGNAASFKQTKPPSNAALDAFRSVFAAYIKAHKAEGINGGELTQHIEQIGKFKIRTATPKQLQWASDYLKGLDSEANAAPQAKQPQAQKPQVEQAYLDIPPAQEQGYQIMDEDIIF